MADDIRVAPICACKCISCRGGRCEECEEYQLDVHPIPRKVAPSSEPSIPADLKMQCSICKGNGTVSRRGFSSAGDMDANSEPRMVTQSCHQCHGNGWLWALSEYEMAERLGRAEDAFMAAGRLRSFFYVKWELAHGPDACKHGIAKAFSCRDCDEATVEAYYAALAAPSGATRRRRYEPR